MAVSTQTVMINVVVHGGGSAQVLNQMGIGGQNAATKLQKASKEVDIFTKLSRAMHNQTMVLTKALVSMAGVLVAFNLAVTLPQLAMRGFVAIVKAMAEAAAELETRVITLQAVLASTQNFSANPMENFATAGKVAQYVMNELLMRSKELNATISEASTVFQAMVSSGVGQYNIKVKEAVDLTILLANAIGGMTIGQDRMRQFASETRALLQGNLAPQNQLVRLLFQSAAEFEKFKKHAMESGTYVKDIQERLFGFVQAIQPMSVTMNQMVSTFKDFFSQFSWFAMGQVFAVLRKELVKFQDQWVTGQEVIRQAAAATGALFITMLDSLVRMVGLTSDDFLGAFSSIDAHAMSIAETFARITAHVRNTFVEVRAIWNAIQGIYGSLKVAFEYMGFLFQKVFIEPANAIIRLLNFITGFKMPTYPTFSFSAIKEDYAKAVGDFKQMVKDLSSTMSPQEAADRAAKVFLEQKKLSLEQIKTMMEDLSRYGEQRLTGKGTEEAAAKEVASLRDRALQTIIKMQQELDVLRVGENSILKIEIERTAKAKELSIEYAKVPEELKKILALNEALRQAEIDQVYKKLGDEMDKMQVNIIASLASGNEFLTLQVRLDAAAEELRSKWEGIKKETLDATISLKATELYTEAMARILNSIDSKKLDLFRETFGEIATLEARRAKDLESINRLQGLSAIQIQNMLAAKNKEYDLERRMLEMRRDQQYNARVGGSLADIEKIYNFFTATREVELQRLDAEKEIQSMLDLEPEQMATLISLNNILFGIKKRQAEVQDSMTRSRTLVDQTRTLREELSMLYDLLTLNARGFGSWGATVDAIKGKIGEMKTKLEEVNAELIKLNEAKAGASGADLKAIEEQIRALSQSSAQLTRDIMDVYEAVGAASTYIPSMEQFADMLIGAWFEMGDAAEGAKIAIKAAGAGVAEAMGAWIAGLDSFGKALAKVFSGLIKKFGDWVLVKGLTALADGIWPPNPALLAKGAALVALAGVIYGIAAAMGGSGGSAQKSAPGGAAAASTQAPAPQYIRQNTVEAQQGIMYGVLERNTIAINCLNNEVSRLSKENGDTLVSKAVKKNPKIVVQPVLSAASKSYDIQRSLGGALVGVNAS